MRNESTASDAIWLTVGRAGRMVLAFLLPVVLTRTLAREDYGAFRQIDLAASLLAPFVLLSLDRSLTNYLPRPDRDPRRETSTVFWAVTGINLVLLAPMLAVPAIPRILFSLSSLYLIVVAVVTTTSAGALMLLMQRALVAQGHGRAAGAAPLLLQIPYVIALLAVAIGSGSLRAVALVVAANGLVVSLASAFLLVWFGLLGPIVDGGVLRRHVRFATPLWLIGTGDTWGSRMDRFLVSASLGSETYGIFSVGVRGVPFLNIIPSSVRDASAPRLSRYQAERRWRSMASLWQKGSEAILPIYIVALSAQVWLAHLLVPAIYTEEFSAAVPVFMVAGATMFLGIFSGLEHVLRAFSAFRFLALTTFVALGLRIAAGLAVLPMQSLALQAGVQALVNYGAIGARLWYTRRLLGVGWSELFPVRGWTHSLGASLLTIGASAVIEPRLTGLSLVPRTAVMLLVWAPAGVFVVVRLFRDRARLREEAARGPETPADSPAGTAGGPQDSGDRTSR